MVLWDKWELGVRPSNQYNQVLGPDSAKRAEVRQLQNRTKLGGEKELLGH